MYLLIVISFFIAHIGWGESATHRPHTLGVEDRNKTKLDLNQNGKPDFFREFYSNGNVAWAKYDFNENGSIDYHSAYKENGDLVFEKIDRNSDGNIDFVKECDLNLCTLSLDDNFDKVFEHKKTLPNKNREVQKINSLWFLKYFN